MSLKTEPYQKVTNGESTDRNSTKEATISSLYREAALVREVGPVQEAGLISDLEADLISDLEVDLEAVQKRA